MMKNRSTLLLLLFLGLHCSLPTSVRADDCLKLPSDTAVIRMRELTTHIRHHNLLYYQKNAPEISDAEYDRLFSELIRLEKCFPEQAANDSPTQTVGMGIENSKIKVHHEKPMLSLSSSIGPETVETLLKKVFSAGEVPTLLVQPKVDGLPVEVVYEAGRLMSASTRGDGISGQAVTDRVRMIKGIPLSLTGTVPVRVVVRGEIYADVHAVALLQEGKTGTYATMRHLAAGTLLSADPDPAFLESLRFFPFELVNAGQCCNVLSDQEALRRMATWGLPVQIEQTYPVKSFEQVRSVYRNFLAHRRELPFSADGIVVKVDDLSLRRQVGEGSRSPFWAAAWKFPPEKAMTVLREITWQMGRAGRRIPVALVVPVDIGGIRVSKVSLHNSAEIARLGITRGSRVIVALVGDVIPRIIDVVDPRISDSRIVSIPVETTPVENDACFRDNPGCRARFLARAVYFTSKSGLDITGLGRGRLTLLIDAGLVQDLPSIVRLASERTAVASVLGSKVAAKLTGSIQSRSHPSPFRLVAAIGIPGVGPVAAQELSRRFSTLAALLSADESQISTLPKVSGAARVVREFFGKSEGKTLLKEFADLGIL